MDIRISQLDNEEVDHLRFDRIKIQRKRMEHILEVIKDLTFKNKELIKQNLMLKEQIEDERRFKRSFQQTTAQRKVLIEKNVSLENQLQRYKETTLQQEILIQRLQEELNYPNYRQTYARQSYLTEPHFAKHIKSQYLTQDQYNASQENFINTQDFEILKMQYKDLQKQYSKLFQSHYSRQKENIDAKGHIYSTKKDDQFKVTEQMLRKTKSYKEFQNQTIQDLGYLKLKQKYTRLKKQKKELQQVIVLLQNEAAGSKLRQQNLVQLVDILKEKKTKICLCHINKLEKQLQLKANLLQHTLNQ